MEEPVWKGHDLHLVERESRPVIDVSYVELPDRHVGKGCPVKELGKDTVKEG